MQADLYYDTYKQYKSGQKTFVQWLADAANYANQAKLRSSKSEQPYLLKEPSATSLEHHVPVNLLDPQIFCAH
jgi:hypothetical protein